MNNEFDYCDAVLIERTSSRKMLSKREKKSMLLLYDFRFSRRRRKTSRTFMAFLTYSFFVVKEKSDMNGR
jgi:hypothetical protein